MSKEFRSVSLNRELIDTIERYVNSELNSPDKQPYFRSIADFLSEAARLRLKQLQKEG